MILLVSPLPTDIAVTDETALWGAFVFAAGAVLVALVNGGMVLASKRVSASAHESVHAQLAEIRNEARSERADVREIRGELHAHIAGMAVRRAELVHDVEEVVERALGPWTRWADAQEWSGVDRRVGNKEGE